MTKCPVCGSADTQAGLDKMTCTGCGAVFNDATGEVQEVRGPFVVGNLADLHRGGAAAAEAGDIGGDHMTAAAPPAAVTMVAAPGLADPAAEDEAAPAKAAHPASRARKRS